MGSGEKSKRDISLLTPILDHESLNYSIRIQSSPNKVPVDNAFCPVNSILRINLPSMGLCIPRFMAPVASTSWL